MFLFYTLMCRNYQIRQSKPCWSRIGTFQKSVSKLFSNIVTFGPEDNVKWKSNLLQSCGKFSADGSRLKIQPNPSPDGWDISVLLNLKIWWREFGNLYKERKPRSQGATNFPPPQQPSWGGEPPQHHLHHQGQPPPPRAAAVAAKGSRRRRCAVAATGLRLHSRLHLFINLSIKLLITMTMCE